MKFGVLGPVRVQRVDAVVELRAGMLRRLLAVLLSRPGEPVTVSALVDALWPDAIPANAVKTVQNYVHRLRGRLGADRIERSPAGYAVALDSGELDAWEFEALLRDARNAKATGDLERAHDRLARGLALWRGSPYADVADCLFLRPDVERLAELRVQALEERSAVGLERGRHAELIPELTALVAEHPYRERACGQLMLALYRSGRQVEALDVFARTRSRLVEELGVDPGQELREMHQAVLGCDPALDHRRSGSALPVTTAPGSEPAAPAQLPPDLTSLSGREAELAELLAVPDQGSTATGAVVINSIDGMAGIGKTALAVHAAHRLADRFPDGQLFLDLHGFTDGLGPVEPATALERMLRALGVSGEQIPNDVEDRSALWRSRVAGRKLLILLDNAASEDQVRLLLPAAPGCLVLVTSRRRLGGLDDVRPMSLDVLPTRDAIALFTRIAGPQRLADGSPEEIVELCGRLPLAVRLVAARFRDRPAWTLAGLAERLRDQQARLAEMEVGNRSVAGAFQLSYQYLDSDLQRFYRLLGLHPGADFDPFAAAALTELSLRESGQALDSLADVHLLQPRRHGRYAFHDLLRAYAADLAESEEADDVRRAGVTRLLDHYLYTASTAMDLHSPHLKSRRPEVSPSPTPSPRFLEPPQARAWLDAERANLIAAAGHAAGHGWAEHAIKLARSISTYLIQGVRPREALVLHGHALSAARARDSLDDQGMAMHHLAVAHQQLGKTAEALEYARNAYDRLRQSGAVLGTARVLMVLAQLCAGLGRYRESLAYSIESIGCHQEVGDRSGEAEAFLRSATACRYLGRLDEALEHSRQALAIAREVGDSRRTGSAFMYLGLVHHSMGLPREALDYHMRAAALLRETGNGTEESLATGWIGNDLRALGRYAEAFDYHAKALAAAERMGEKNCEFEARLGLGTTLHASGREREAIGELRRAVELARELEHRHDEGLAHDAMAAVLRDLGDEAGAREHWELALLIYADLDVPGAAEVRAHLAAATS